MLNTPVSLYFSSVSVVLCVSLPVQAQGIGCCVGALLITISNLGFVADLNCRQKEKDEVARMIESLKNLGGRGLKV